MSTEKIQAIQHSLETESQTIKMIMDNLFSCETFSQGPESFERVLLQLWDDHAETLSTQLTQGGVKTAEQITEAFAMLFDCYCPDSFGQYANVILHQWDLPSFDDKDSEQERKEKEKRCAVFPPFQAAYLAKLNERKQKEANAVLLRLDQETRHCLDELNKKIMLKTDRLFPARFHVDTEMHTLLLDLQAISGRRANTPAEQLPDLLNTYIRRYQAGTENLKTLPDRRVTRFFKMIESITATVATCLVGGLFLVPKIMKTKAEHQAEQLDQRLLPLTQSEFIRP